jgi:hypothetical protein
MPLSQSAAVRLSTWTWLAAAARLSPVERRSRNRARAGENPGLVGPLVASNSDESEFLRNLRHVPGDLHTSEEFGLVRSRVRPVLHARSRKLRLATRPVTGVNAQPELGRDSTNRASTIQTPKELLPLLRLVLLVLLTARSINHNMLPNSRVLRRCLEFKPMKASCICAPSKTFARTKSSVTPSTTE